MIVYFIFFVIMLLFRVFCKKEKSFLSIIGLMLWGLLAFRSINLGLYDTKTVYFSAYNMLTKMNIIDIFEYRWMDDKLFYIVMKVINLLFNNYQICIAILAMPFVYITVKFIEKNSKNAFWSLIVYISLYYMYGTFLLRQVIAIGIILLSIRFIEEKDLKKFVIVVLLASLFHKTALIFLISYPFAVFNRYGYKNYFYILISLLISFNLGEIIIEVLKRLDFTNKIALSINNNLYTINGEISMFGLIITVSMLTFANYYRKVAIRNKEYDYRNDVYLNISTLGSVLYTFSKVISEFYRGALYFSIVNILLISNFICYEKDIRVRRVEKFILYIIFVLYFLTRTINNVNANPYIFFWQ